MPTNYAGSDLTYPANVPLPNDGEPAAAAFLNPAWQRLADRTAYLNSLLVTRERTSELEITADATLTTAQQLAYVNITGGGFVTLPAPASSSGRMFRLRLSTTATKISRLMPNASETINGASGGFPLSEPGAHYVVFTPDGTNWLAFAERGSTPQALVSVFHASDLTPDASDTVQIYGAGFLKVFEVLQNGFGISGIGGSKTINDDGWITIVCGGGGGQVELSQLVIDDAEDPDYDGATVRALVSTGIDVNP